MRRIPSTAFVLLLSLLSIIGVPVRAQTANDDALKTARQLLADWNKGDYDKVYATFDETMVSHVTKDQLKAARESIARSEGDYRGEIALSVQDFQGYKVVALALQFRDGTNNAIVSINAKGQVSGFVILPASPPVQPPAADEQEITFRSGEDTFHGTLLIPARAKGNVPAVLLISGSGPTDRDGNSRLLPGKIDSHRNFARVLADAGIASLRYDKLGTGKTGLGSHTGHLAGVTFDVYLQTAMDAYAWLGGRAGIDAAHMAILGHSEGGLIALLAAGRMKTPPAALILAAPLSKPYLATIRDQFAAQYAAAVKAGQMAQQQVDDAMAELDRITGQILKDGTTPASMCPRWQAVFPAVNNRFLQTAAPYDPPRVAAALPPALKVLILCGQKDQQVPCSDVRLLADGFRSAGNTGVQFFALADVDHVFREIEGTPDPHRDYTDPNKPFSKEAAQRIGDFVKGALVP